MIMVSTGLNYILIPDKFPFRFFFFVNILKINKWETTTVMNSIAKRQPEKNFKKI